MVPGKLRYEYYPFECAFYEVLTNSFVKEANVIIDAALMNIGKADPELNAYLLLSDLKKQLKVQSIAYAPGVSYKLDKKAQLKLEACTQAYFSEKLQAALSQLNEKMMAKLQVNQIFITPDQPDLRLSLRKKAQLNLKVAAQSMIGGKAEAAKALLAANTAYEIARETLVNLVAKYQQCAQAFTQATTSAPKPIANPARVLPAVIKQPVAQPINVKSGYEKIPTSHEIAQTLQTDIALWVKQIQKLNADIPASTWAFTEFERSNINVEPQDAERVKMQLTHLKANAKNLYTEVDTLQQDAKKIVTYASAEKNKGVRSRLEEIKRQYQVCQQEYKAMLGGSPSPSLSFNYHPTA